MSDSGNRWFTGILFLALAGSVGYTSGPARTQNKRPASTVAATATFNPPAESEIPDNQFGEMVRLGEHIFHGTQATAREFFGNDLRCSNCHLDNGRLANASP